MHLPRLRTLAAALLLLCAAPPAAARQERAERSSERAESKEQELLGRSVKLYWDAVRWGDAEKAASFIEDPQVRVLYRDQLEQDRSARRVEDYSMLQVVLNPKPTTPDALREARVTVRLSGFTVPQQILKTERLDQVWYRTLTGWHLRWDDAVQDADPTLAPR
jgi:hypothetical protein